MSELDRALAPGDADCCGDSDAPHPIRNRAALPAVAYRAGTHPTFLRRMLAALPEHEVVTGDGQSLRPLAALATRSSEDPAIALLDAWACVADVLTFYSERIANEGYLRTATERRSVLELARGIGYELRPGVSATAYLAVTVDDSPVSPGSAEVPVGTKVASVPAKGQLPQTFETSETFTARAAWNALRPRLTQPQPLDPAASTVYLDGQVGDIQPDVWLLFVSPGAATPKKVTAARFDAQRGRTEVTLANQPKPPPPFHYRPRRPAVPVVARLPLTEANVRAHILDQDWAERDLAGFLRMQGWQERAVADHIRNLALSRTPELPPPPAPPVAVLAPPAPGLYAFGTRVAAFGHNAPRYASLPEGVKEGADWDAAPLPPITDSRDNLRQPGEFFVERVVPEVVRDSWVLVQDAVNNAPATPYRVSSVRETSLAAFALSGRATGVVAAKVTGTPAGDAELAGFKFRSTTIHVGSRSLALAPLPIEDPLGSGTVEQTQLTLDTTVFGLREGQPLILTGERADLAGVVASDVVRLSRIVHSGGLTTVFFDGDGLRHRYLRSTVTINANVVEATHGETVHEVLGSGDGSRASQRFVLRRPPLAYVSAPTATGARSSLQVRANGIAWDEAPTLFGLGPRDERHVVRVADDGTAAVIFGDGEQGARPPTGIENVTATYRTGGGRAGLVEADSLTLLQTRPPGVRAVTNPVPADGAAEPETLDAARGNAPLAVLALDRIVSLRDLEDFASAFAAVGKAQAVAVWDGHNRVAHLTVAAETGAVIDRESRLARDLVAAIRGASEPTSAVRVDGHQPLFFDLTARILVDSRFSDDTVVQAVRAAVVDTFSFDRRGFAQPVATAEVVAAMQQVSGVVAVDLDRLYLIDQPAAPSTPATVLAAEPARVEGGEIRPAQLLLANPMGITLTPVGEML